MSANREEKLKALQLTMDKLDKLYGKGAVMKLGDSTVVEADTISTGSLSLDLALIQSLFSQQGECQYLTKS